MKKIIIVLIIALIAGVGIYVSVKQPANSPPPPQAASPSKQPVSSSQTIVASEVAKHATADSCWVIVDKNVYDVTPFIKSGMHPGGDKILRGCGKDLSEQFTRPPHAGQGRTVLANYLLGPLAVSP